MLQSAATSRWHLGEMASKGCQLSPDDGEEEGGQEEDGFQSSDTESHHSHGDPDDLDDVESDSSQSLV